MMLWKRLLTVLLAAALCLCLAACSGSDEPVQAEAPAPVEEEKETPAPTPEPTLAPTPEPTPDISAFVGDWKYDAEPYYVRIGADFTWSVIDLYGKTLAEGTLTADNDTLNLVVGNGAVGTSLRRIVGGLSDNDGDTLTAAPELLLLPTPQDPLTETASFQGDFSKVNIQYPKTMTATLRSDFENGLSFNALLEDGTDDYYSNILIAFMHINGYDPYMSQGEGTAKIYMKDMMDKLAASVYGNKVLQNIGTDFTDHGDYYSMIGYLWLDSSIFGGGLTQPVRGTMEIRYYGPTGYALVAMTFSLESRIQNYFLICNKLLDSCNYTAMWSTSPKPAPARPAARPSDSGDYGTPYYWYDEDGDVWYWNGYSNEFIGFGDDYYIGDDGYYESNDDGWDPEYYDYYDDYDPWSDPGDGWEDWDDWEYDWDEDWDW